MGQQQVKGEYASIGQDSETTNDVDQNANLTFVFHDNPEKDSSERVVHESEQPYRDTSDEPSWTIYTTNSDKKLIFGIRRSFNSCELIGKLPLREPTLLEFPSEDCEHEWAVYLSDSIIIFWKDGKTYKREKRQISKKCRIVNDVYNPIAQRRVNNTLVQQRTNDECNKIQFSNSESWACWCYYGDCQFSASYFNNAEPWYIHWNDLSITEKFNTLDEAIASKRLCEKKGLSKLQKTFGVSVVHKGFVTCIQ